MIKRNLLLASAMFCSVGAFADTNLSIYSGAEVSVRVAKPESKMVFVGNTMTFDNAAFVSVDSVVFNHYVSVVFDGAKATVSNPFDSVEVKVDGAKVEINSLYTAREVKYKFSGKSSDGNVVFSSLYKSKFELDNLDLTSAGVNPPIYILTKKNTEVHLTGANILKDSDKDTVGATIRARGQFQFKGDGSLDITGVVGHGIQSSDYVEVKNGKISINAASDGIHVNDYYLQSGGSVNIQTKADGIDIGEGYAEINGGTLTVASATDGARGIRCTKTEKENSGKIDINGGELDIQLSGMGSRGLKADDNVTVKDGKVLVVMSGKTHVATTDTTVTCGIKSDGIVTVDGGRVVVICQKTAASSRCVQSDGAININGGVTVLYQNATEKVTGAKKPNVVKSDADLNVKKAGTLYVKADADYVKLYNVGNVYVGNTVCYTDPDDDGEDEYVGNFIFAEPDFWNEYSKYDK